MGLGWGHDARGCSSRDGRCWRWQEWRLIVCVGLKRHGAGDCRLINTLFERIIPSAIPLGVGQAF